MVRRVVGGITYTLAYTVDNRITSVTWGGNTSTFAYDGDGNRVRSIANGATVTYYVGNYYEVTGNTVTKYYYFAGYRVAMTSTGSANPTFIHGDHLGSAANSTGQFTNTEMYLPYGGIRGSSTVTTPYRFTGQREEASFGLYYYNARWYDPVLGRFIQADTIVPEPGNPQSLNRYSYVLNSPVRYSDPSGKYSEDEIKKAFGASTWDEVLDWLRSGGALEGRWGWLEVLRRANDGDWMSGLSVYPSLSRLGGGREAASIAASDDIGTFSRGATGRILVGGLSHRDFAVTHYRYSLSAHGSVFTVDSSTIAFHLRGERVKPDPTGALSDLNSVAIDLISLAGEAVAPPAIFGLLLGVVKDWRPAAAAVLKGLNYQSQGRIGSSDVLDVVSLVPLYGMVSGLVNALSHFTGLQVSVTP